MDFKTVYNDYTSGVETALRTYFDEAAEIAEPLKSAMEYSLLSGGKRLRPVLVLSANALLGGGAEEALPVACAVEMIHTYSLIHDDLPAMDDDDLRRGKPTNHMVFGEGMAVLAGDGLLSYAFEILLNNALKHPQNAKGHLLAMRRIAAGAGVYGMVGGQCMDLFCQDGGAADAKTLEFIHRNKTGAMIVSSLLAGLHLCSPDDGQVAAVRAYGADVGLAFQITDDILDVVGDAKKLGKNPGSDARAKKLTYPALHGLDAAREKVDGLVRSARASIECFGERAAFLQELAAALGGRES
jgi:geranylgeranyl diphosphate synthase type II